METKNALLTVVVILAFALIVTSLGQLTGFSVNDPSRVTITPESILPGDTVSIVVNPGQEINNEVVIYKLPSDARVEQLKLECGGYRCVKGQVASATYTTSLTDSSGDYVVRIYNLNGEEVGSGRFTVL